MQEKRLDQPFVQRQEENEEEKPEEVQTKRASTISMQRLDLSSRLQRLQGGEPLPASTRALFEPRFSADFSAVRVHRDSEAAETAQKLNAQAFTRGRDIVFGPGRYQPQSPHGQRLLAHELTHVLQQGSAGSVPVNGASRGAIVPAHGGDAVIARQEKKEEKKEPEVAFGSPAWPWPLIETLIVKLPSRWSEAVKRAKQSKGSALFDRQFGRTLVYNQLMAFYNLFYAGVFTGLSAYKVDFSKGLEISESLSGVTDTYLNLISLALHYDLKKYLENDVSDIVKANLGWAIIYGLLIQGGLVGLNQALEQELDFTSLVVCVQGGI